jgi:hypothetical protein
MSKRLHIKYPLFLSYFNYLRIFSTDFRKSLGIPSFIKIRPVGAELFHADGETNMTKIIVAFRNFANASKKQVCGLNFTGSIGGLF